MTIQDVKKMVNSVIASHIKDQKLFSFTELDSLGIMEVIMDIEDTLDISIPLQNLNSVKSIEEMHDLVLDTLSQSRFRSQVQSAY
jgi:acyl carrier protein